MRRKDREGAPRAAGTEGGVRWFRELHNATTEELDKLATAYELLNEETPSKVSGVIPVWTPPANRIWMQVPGETFWAMS